MGCLNQPCEVNKLVGGSRGCLIKPFKGTVACMVNSEIGAVLAVMRRNVRWGVHYGMDNDHLEHSLIQSFKELRKNIFLWPHKWHTIDPAVYLLPFLDVIKSDETGAPITGVALSSVYKILTLEILDQDSVNVKEALHLIVDVVTSCRFEVTDPASEEVVLMKILQVLLACMKNRASFMLSNHHACNIVNTCFRVVHQASSKGELLQRIARHTMHEVIRCIFLHLPGLEEMKDIHNERDKSNIDNEGNIPSLDHICGNKQSNGGLSLEHDAGSQPGGVASSDMLPAKEEIAIEISQPMKASQSEGIFMAEPYGIPCMVEIFQFLCSLLNVMEHTEVGPRSNPIAYDEDVPLFALGLINSAIELGGTSFGYHPKLLALIQDELFRNLMQFGLSMSPLILSTVCSIVLNLYHHLCKKLKLQIEAFFSGVLLRVAQDKNGASYQQQEVAMEALVDFCRQPNFMAEMYVNFDCDVSCRNVFEDLISLLSKSAFPVKSSLSATHIVALEGLNSMIQYMAERVGHESLVLDQTSLNLEEYRPFWMIKCENYDDPNYWIPYVNERKFIKKKLMIGADHFNRDPKKGLEFLQATHLLPEEREPLSVACFFRYTIGLDKNAVGDFLGNHDEFCIQVLHEFARTFDFQGMNLDTALRVFLETFRLPGEAQKIQRILEAFAERYYEQSPNILANKDAALLLSYSLILLNTDQHNAQVKKKMTEEDFIRNNRRINGGNDLPREYLSELYHSICLNEMKMITEQDAGFPIATSSHWIGLLHKSKHTTPFTICNSFARLDYGMFLILSGPTIAAISVVLDHVEQDDVLQTCIDGFLATAKIAASFNLDDVLNDLVVSLCKFTTLLLPLPAEESIYSLGYDTKARMATVAVFTIANRYGDHIRVGWRNILDCILSLQRFGLLRPCLASTAADDTEASSTVDRSKPTPSSTPVSRTLSMSTPRKSSGLMGHFSQLLYIDTEEPAPQLSEEQLAAHQRSLQMIEDCHIDTIFAESKFLQADSLLQLSQSLISAADSLRTGNNAFEREDGSVFCLELLIAITLNNRDRIMLLWPGVFEHITNIVQSIVMPCALVEKAVFGLLQICQRLLPYKENLTDELLKSLQLVLKLDARVADAYCEQITQEVMRLVKSNAMQIRSYMGWRTITSLLSITARHPEASEFGFETLVHVMSDGIHLSPANFVLCVNAARQFAESRVGHVERSRRSIDLMASSIICLVRWSNKTEAVREEAAAKVCQDIGEMWLRLVQGLRKVCLDQREKVRNHAILMLQRCVIGVDGIHIPKELWLQCFDLVLFTLLDDLLEILQRNSSKDYRSLEGALVLSLKLLSKAFLQSLQDLSQLTSFCKIWVGVLGCIEKCMKAEFRGKRSEKIHELVPELLKNTLLVMKTSGILVPNDVVGGDSFWQLTWLHVKNIVPSLQSEVFSSNELEQLQTKRMKTSSPISDGNAPVPSGETET